jgi:uncharacterized delta-60 repeat protein
MRFSPSGSPGRLGEVSLGPGALVELADLVPEGDSFVAIGDLSGAKNGPGAFLARFSDAAFPYDPIFGGGAGLVRLGPLPNSEHNVSLEGAAADDGGLIAVGRWGNRILLARYNPNGTPDQGFGEAGLASLSLPASLASLPGAYASAKAESVVVQPDGHYVIAGSARIGNDRGACDIKNGYCEYAFLARFEPNGSLDASFGESGFVIGHRVYERPGLALQPGGKILLSQSSLRVARYNADGSLDTSFGKGGETGAFPCRGSVAARRRSGCLSTAMVSLGAHGLSHGRPMSQFSVRASNPLDPIATVVLQLPRELGGRPGAAGMVRVLTVPRSRVQVRVLPSSVTVSRLGDARGIHVGIGGGVLRRLAPIAATQELLFRVEVEFKDGTTKSFRFRSSG